MTDSDNYPSNWRLVKIGDVCRVRRGASPRPIDSPEWFSNEGRGWVRIVDVTRSDGRLRSTEQRLSKKGEALSVAVDPGQLIMSIAATVGVPAVVEIPVCIHDGFVVFDQYDTNVDTVFLFHFIDYYIPKFRSQGQTGTQSNINTSIVNTMPLPLPPLEEQRAIADILDTIDAAIQNAERVIAKQKAIRSGLLHDLLTYGLDANGEPNYTRPICATRYGTIPAEWEIQSLGSIADIGSGVTLGRNLDGQPIVELPYLRVWNVQAGYVDLSDIKTVMVRPDEVSRYKLEAGDVLMTEGGDFDKLGRGTVWRGEIEPCLHQNHIFRVRTNQDQLLPDFLELISGAPYGRLFFMLGSKQSTNLASINATQLNSFPIPLPKIGEQQAIIDVVKVQDAAIARETAHHDKLIAKKKGLMDDLLTGRVRVSDVRLDEVTEQKQAYAQRR